MKTTASSRPLIITDCDEVLLRMIPHFRDWLEEDHDILLDFSRGFGDGMRRRGEQEPLPHAEMWKLLGSFFDTQMHRQDAVPGSIAAMHTLSDHAEVVVLTNLEHFRNDTRRRQLAALGLDVPVYTNQGPKGPALQAILAERGEHRPAFFIDDLSVHHNSVAVVAPAVTRLHFVGEPGVAPHVECAFKAGDAHARIDDWQTALSWLLKNIEGQDS
ncbi:HAD family hydrolase [Croceicoccus sp. F390]|uniref:HAD family hydrolase n=1 Tax=Croceicoccus esteveae TaxID=3075597 RepID=A0ABU2ZJX0_9SPHN|nr:HAD family hydrolase [Croceicoccus sp. F390]MDT0576516.1 HAD family hydrolase [Croceicoccus sp. F390]